MTRHLLAFAEDIASVNLSEAEVTTPVVLALDGVAGDYEVSINGTLVVADRSMFARHRIDVSSLVVPGPNLVQVTARPLSFDEVPSRPRARWRTALVDEARLRWVRTRLIDWCPGIPTGPVASGPWRPTWLLTGASVAEVTVRTSVVDGAGVIEVFAEGRLLDRQLIPNVQLWWPHTHGIPSLYRVLVHVGGELVLDRQVGFRTLDNTDPSSLALSVNGVPVFVRGAVWTPGTLDALDRAVELGLNLVRIPGIASYESEEFHARCDQLGLMVWQDLMFSNFDYPLADPAFADVVRDEVTAETAALLGHPSTVVVCGSSEVEQQAAMYGVPPGGGAAAELGDFLEPLMAASGLDVIWVPSTPTGGALPIRVDRGIAHYYGVGGYRRPLSDARTSGVRFAAESLAFANPPADGATGGVPFDPGADWDFADVTAFYADLGFSSGEVMAAVFGEWRRAASPCHGGIVMWLRDLAPGAGWGLLDSSSTPKRAALDLAPVLQPVAVWLVDEGVNGLGVHVANDTASEVTGTLSVSLHRADGSPVDSGEASVTVAARGSIEVDAESVLGRFADASYYYRFGPPGHDRVRASLVTADGTLTAEYQVRGVAAPS